ncbi:outer membrane beta-barrel protein [Myroides fluvii]|uniref:outer membrane beta-barrel protein n=1 Tax=Myroides fluvii TaxID=2572594 RepID=UPI00131EA5EA|nr:outer membrane beta-barrel protein [Myroides fluvii]
MKLKLYIALVGILSSGFSTIQAQFKSYYYPDHEIGINLKAGWNQAYGSLPQGIGSDRAFTMAFGLQYDYYVSPTWSLGIGGQYAMQTTNFSGTNLKGKRSYIDTENDTFTFSYLGKKYKEEWKVNQFNLPLTVQYVGKGETSLYVRTGIQFSVIMSSKTTLTWNNLTAEGYFPQYNVVFDHPWFAGFGDKEKMESKPKLDLKNRWAWIAEVGVKHNLKSNQNLYVGVYLDLGLNNQSPAVSTTKEDLITYKPELDNAIEFNSIQQQSAAVFKNYSVGIQLRYGIGL